LEGKFEAVQAHYAATTHLFGFSGRCASLREEQVRVYPEAVCLVMPGFIDGSQQAEVFVHEFPPIRSRRRCSFLRHREISLKSHWCNYIEVIVSYQIP
jgi:hypothetical protein